MDCEIIPQKVPDQELTCNLDGYLINIECYPSVIQITDNEGNVIDIHKRKERFYLRLKGLFRFKDRKGFKIVSQDIKFHG